MFDRNKRETSDESATFATFEDRQDVKTPESRSHAREAAIIGPSIQINGDLSGEEDLIIQGKVTGTIQLKEKSLTVGTQGKVNANVLAKRVIVEGEVKGDLYGSENVAIRKTGNVHGNIVSPKVSLEEGCRFKGSIDMDQEMTNVSGGELQKTFIAASLASEADLYLFDEPSAYLSVEDRLVAAKVIHKVLQRSKKAGFIVEHDIVFQDYVSDKLMVFLGDGGIYGKAYPPTELEKGMNRFLSNIEVTFRRDFDSGRPRVNKSFSKLDKEQRREGRYYYG